MSISKNTERIVDISAPLGAAQPRTGVRSYVIDTSVLLSDPRAVLRFAEHEVVLPVVVITELEGKRHDPELGYFARQALRLLDDLRVEHHGLNRPVPIGDQGGTLVVELNHVSDTVLPVSFRLKDNDSLILAVALSLSNDGRDVCIVSKDLPMRVKASALGLEAEEYRAEWVGSDVEWSGTASVDVPDDVVDRLYTGEAVVVPGTEGLPANTGLTLHSTRGSALARIRADGAARVVRGDRDRRRPVFPGVQPHRPRREVRPVRRLCAAVGARTRRHRRRPAPALICAAERSSSLS
jgi:PhoH-like ATPase